VERFTGRRWNGAEWNQLELAKSGPSVADVSVEAASGDALAVVVSGDFTGQIRQLAPAFARHLVPGLSGRKSVSPAFSFGRNRKGLVITTFCCRPA
jgi:hypothetical protein